MVGGGGKGNSGMKRKKTEKERGESLEKRNRQTVRKGYIWLREIFCVYDI